MSEAMEVLSPSERRAERELDLRARELTLAERQQWSPNEAAFQLEMRQAKSLAASPFLPDAIGKFKDKDGNEMWNGEMRIAAAWGVLRYAQLLGVDAYVLAQQIYVVHGRVSFSTSFLVGMVNSRAGLRKAIDWTIEGAGQTLKVTCTATGADGIDRAVTMTMAEAQSWGWSTKPGQAWKADPALMLQYRTASKMIRLYFSDAVFGLTTSDELEAAANETIEIVQPAPKGRAALGGRAAEPRRIVEHLPPQATEAAPEPTAAKPAPTAVDTDEDP